MDDTIRHRAAGARAGTPWICAFLIGAIVCGVIGPALPVLIIFSFDAVRGASMRNAARSLVDFPFGWLVAIIQVGPASALVGGLGACWIRFRSASVPAQRRLLVEAILLGTLLGCAVPLSTLLEGPFPLKDLRWVVSIGAPTGLVCGLLVVVLLRKLDFYLPVSSPTEIQH
jgi:hypothetical protein